MEKSIRVRILGREYGLRVDTSDEAGTREIAGYLDAKMRAFREQHPDQEDTTTAVIAALAIAEELFTTERDIMLDDEELTAVLDALSARLDEALDGT